MTPAPTRLLVVTTALSGGGAERETAILLDRLPRERFDLELALFRPGADDPVPADVVLHDLGKRRPWHLFRAVHRLRRVIETSRPDVVFSMLLYPSLLAERAVASAHHPVRWIVRLTNPPEQQLRGWRGLWARRTLPRGDRILASSRGVARALEKALDLAEGSVVAVDNPVDLETIERKAGEPLPIPRDPAAFVVVHAGRLHPQKDQATLLRAFAGARLERGELWILGRGTEERRLRGLAGELGIADSIRWLGFRPNPYPFYRAADCFALSSRWEGLPNVIVESMACGTPVVSTRCRYGPDELIEDGVDGRLVDEGTPEAMAEVFRSWRGGPATLETLGARAGESVRRRFATESTVSRFATLLEPEASP